MVHKLNTYEIGPRINLWCSIPTLFNFIQLGLLFKIIAFKIKSIWGSPCIFGKGMNHLSSSYYGWIVGHNGLFSRTVRQLIWEKENWIQTANTSAQYDKIVPCYWRHVNLYKLLYVTTWGEEHCQVASQPPRDTMTGDQKTWKKFWNFNLNLV